MKPKLIIGVIAGVLVCGQAVAQTITVTKPTATDVWVKGEPATIQWVGVGNLPPTCTIRLRNAADTSTVQVITDSTPTNVGSFQWAPVPTGLADGQYRVRVYASNFISGTSAAFLIGQIKVTSPNGGESWQSGATKQITWTPGAATGTVKIELYRNGTAPANKVGVIAPSVAATAGTYGWNVGTCQNCPAQTGAGYRVMVSSTSSVLQDASDNPFTITAQGQQSGGFHAQPGGLATSFVELHVLEPTKDSQWTIGTLGTVSWNAAADVKFPLWVFLVSADHKVPIMDMGKIGGPNDRPTAMQWTVTDNIYEGQYCVRITSADDKVQVHSQPFSIVIQTVEYDIKAEVYQNWAQFLPYADQQPPPSVWPDYRVVPPGANDGNHAAAGYNYHSMVWPQTGATVWLASCYRSRVYFMIDQYQPRKAKFISAKMHLKQIAVQKLNDSHASCATGYFLLTALWTDWYNPSVTTPNPTAGLNFGSTDYTIDITDTVKRWFNSTPMNYGLLLTSEEVTWGQQPKNCGSLFDVNLVLTFKKN